MVVVGVNGAGDRIGEDADVMAVVAVVHVPAGELVLAPLVVIDFRREIVARIGIGPVAAEIVGAGRSGGCFVRLRVKRHDVHSDRIQAVGRNAIAGEKVAYVAATHQLGARRIVRGDENAARIQGLREVARALQSRGHGEGAGIAVAPPRPFVAEEEECLVVPHGPAHGAAEDVVPQGRLDLVRSRYGREEIGRVHFLVAEILEQTAVELVGARLGGRDHHAAGGSAVLRRVAVGKDLDLLQDLDRGIDVHLPDAEPGVLHGAAVDPEHLALGAAPGQAEIRFGAAVIGHEYRGAHHVDHVHGAAVSQRHVLDRLRLDQLIDVGIHGLQNGSARRNAHALADRSQLNGDVEFQGLPGGQRDAFAGIATKPGVRNHQFVLPDRQKVEGIVAGFIGARGRAHAGRDIHGDHFGIDDDRVLRVGDGAGDHGLLRLRAADADAG